MPRAMPHFDYCLRFRHAADSYCCHALSCRLVMLMLPMPAPAPYADADADARDAATADYNFIISPDVY